jgi:Protein of unknown function (DUF4232)
MRTFWVMAAALAYLLTGCADAAHLASATPAGRPSGRTASAPRSAHTLPCRAGALVLRPGAFVSPMTGEHALMYALTNRGAVTCTVEGYPRVVLYGRSGIALPFRYTKGGGPYVTRGRPRTVVLAPGSSAHVLVAKYRCDIGTAATATTIRLTLPGARGATFTGREAVGGPGSPDLSYCRGGPHDSGQAVAVSPIEPSQQGAFPL